MTTLIRLLYNNIKTFEQFKTRIQPMISLFILLIAEGLVCKLQLFQNYSLLIILLNGMYFGLMTSKIVVATMAKSKTENFNIENLIYLISILIILYTKSLTIEIALLSINTLFIIARYSHYMYSITAQLLKYLNISF